MVESEDAVLYKPIVVIGAPRSGTSFLLGVLRAHPRVAALPEPRITWRFGNDRRSDLLRPEHARPEVIRHIRGSFAERARAEGKERIAEKTPSNALRMGFVDRVLPGCKFVHVLRNGEESVLSIRDSWNRNRDLRTGIRRRRWRLRIAELDWRRAPFYAGEIVRRGISRRMPGVVSRPVWGPVLPGIDAMLRELDVLEVACLQWRMCVELACQYGRSLPSDRYMELRLEDLTPEHVGSILEFCELEEHPAVRRRFEERFARDRTAGRGREAKPEERETLRSWIGPTLQWLGYR